MALPQQLGRYTLERRLAAGGMAEVFLARQSGPEGFEKVCVVKRMLPHLNEDQTFVAMFLDEARLAARLTHPNLAQIFDFGHDDEEDAYFLAMEYVPGANLHRVIDDHARRHSVLPVGAVVKIIALASAGLDFAHHATDDAGVPLNIIHRDISPHNIMLSKNGDVKVIDFGIAKANVGLHATKAGTLKGKYAYMAPEQIKGQPLDRRTDIYAMGLVLYELLAGRPAITGDSEATLMGNAARRDFTPIESLRVDVPDKIRAVVERATALNLSDRYNTAGELADDLEDFLVSTGTRVRSTELASLLTASTNITNVTPGTPSHARPFLATPATTLTERDESIAPTAKSPSMQLPTKPETPAAKTLDEDAGDVTSPAASPALAEAPSPSRRFPAAIAIGLVVLAAAATVVVYVQTRAPAEPAPSVLVPLPPERANVVEAPTPVEPMKPVEATPATPEPTKPPVEATTETPKATTAKKQPTPPHVATKPPAATPQGKGTVVFRVLPYAEVFREGQSVGITPLKPLELDAGKYTFKFVCNDTKKTESREVTVQPGAQAVLKVDLR